MRCRSHPPSSGWLHSAPSVCWGGTGLAHEATGGLLTGDKARRKQRSHSVIREEKTVPEFHTQQKCFKNKGKTISLLCIPKIKCKKLKQRISYQDTSYMYWRFPTWEKSKNNNNCGHAQWYRIWLFILSLEGVSNSVLGTELLLQHMPFGGGLSPCFICNFICSSAFQRGHPPSLS